MAALDAERGRGETQHHAAFYLIAAPDFRNRPRPTDPVSVLQQIAHHRAEHRRARVLGDGLHVLQKAVPFDRRRIRRLRADVRLAVVLCRDNDRVIGVRDAVLAGHLPERPRDVKRGKVFRRLVHRLYRRRRQRLHHEPGIVHPPAVLSARRRLAALEHLVDDVRRRRACPALRNKRRHAAHRPDADARLRTSAAYHLVGREPRHLQYDLALAEVPSSVVGRDRAFERHRDHDAGKHGVAVVGYAQLVARREVDFWHVLVPRALKHRECKLRGERCKLVRQRHVSGVGRDVARLCAVAVQYKPVVVYISCRHAAHLLT